MKIETFVLDTPPVIGGRSLRMAAKRYRRARQAPLEDGVTLLMLHGLGQHKEQWEPVIEKLYALQSGGETLPRIREVWSFDWQSHGESAVLNEDALEGDPTSSPVDRWADAVAVFTKSNFVEGHLLVGIGYSSGTMALMVSTTHFAPDQCPYIGIILVEPTIMDQETWDTKRNEIQPAFAMVTNAVNHRRDLWSSKEAAHQFFLGRFPWNTWDPRVVALFVKHALRDVKDKDGNSCVSRSCPKIHEANAFQVNMKVTWDAAEQVAKLSGVVPIHVILGEEVDLMPGAIRDSAIDTTKGRRVDSITRIPNVGHAVVQQLPDVLSSTISDLLSVMILPDSRQVSSHL
ncbi:Alpha/beta hydrolase fold-1 [Mycena sp. CBHHK59/15]|nr:Alpha/beta hydrolase fold-1 [Mycena sp. CBHHK59/15]